MNLINKSTPEFSVELYLILPTFLWFKKTTTYRKTAETTTKINVNLFTFSLTKEPKYFILELGFIIGLGIKVIDKEN